MDVKNLKSIQKSAVKCNINFKHYRSVKFERKTHLESIVSLRSQLYEIRTLAINKVDMWLYDDKSYLLDDGISSLPMDAILSITIYYLFFFYQPSVF